MARILDLGVDDVRDLFEGTGGFIRELVLGEHTHIGGEEETKKLAAKLGLREGMVVLDVGCGHGGPARYLAKNYGCKVVGLDSTPGVIEEAVSRTKGTGVEELAIFRLGNALDMPFKKGTFDAVIGQDAWCYITDKDRLIRECARVLKPRGMVGFTDWLETDLITDDERLELHSFMIFPYLETVEGYVQLLKVNEFELIEAEDLWEQFHRFLITYQAMILKELGDKILAKFGDEKFQRLSQGVEGWVKAAADGKVTWGRFIGQATT